MLLLLLLLLVSPGCVSRPWALPTLSVAGSAWRTLGEGLSGDWAKATGQVGLMPRDELSNKDAFGPQDVIRHFLWGWV